MIVPMKKLSIICLGSDTDSTLGRLRDLGVLHVVHVNPPGGSDLARAEAALQHVRLAADVLRPLPEAKKAGAPGNVNADDHAAAAAAADAVHKLVLDARLAGEKIDALTSEHRAMEPFGDFDPQLVHDLAAAGVSVRLYRVPHRKPLQAPEGAHLLVLRSDSSGQCLVLVGKGDCRIDAAEVPVPSRQLSEVAAEIGHQRASLLETNRKLAAACASLPLLRHATERLAAQVDYLRARAGMGAAGPLAYMIGFCPGNRVDEIRAASAAAGWGLLVEDPGPDDAVPTLVHHPAWVQPIEALFSTIKILPGYREADVSAAFLVFLSLFFAMIIGDAGYGLVFLLLTWFARWRLPKAPRDPFRLMTLFSVCAIVWGVLCGAYFGVVEIPAPLQRLRVDWLGDNTNVMHLCLIISAIHLSLAHFWNMVRCINTLQAIAQAGWIAITWTIFFLTRQMIVGIALPASFWVLLGAGLAAVILFMTPVAKLKSDWVNHLMLPLSLMSNFGDVLSYLRLFALGIAGMKLAGAFNAMAMSLGFSNPLTGLIAALILFAGHSLNIALSAISVLVHGVRLNALEFSMHFGLEWSGFRYEPFAVKATANEGTT